jgi:hypothetical protein
LKHLLASALVFVPDLLFTGAKLGIPFVAEVASLLLIMGISQLPILNPWQSPRSEALKAI